MARILLTGGSGFVGRHLRPGLAACGHEVLAPGHGELELADAESVRGYLRANRPEVVVHAATKPAHRNARDVTGIVEANQRMFFNLVRDRDLCPRMVFLGSGAVYGAEHCRDRTTEESFDEHVPTDEHGFSKYVIAKYIAASEGITELRMFGVFGPHEDYAIRFVSNAICKTLFDLPVTLRQDRRFDYLWVEDLTRVVAHFAEHDGRHAAYNVTSDETSSLKALAELVIALSGKDLPLLVAAEGAGNPYSGDNARLRAELPGVTFTPMAEAVERLYDWYAGRVESLDRSSLLLDK